MESNFAAAIGSLTGLLSLLIPLGFFVLVGWAVSVIAQQRTRREAQRAELQAKLLERVGSAREFGEFLGSAAGDRFLQALAPVEPPRNRLIASIRWGAFAVTFALILLGAHSFRLLGREGDDLKIVGIIILAVGLATLVAAGLSHAAARRLGLDN